MAPTWDVPVLLRPPELTKEFYESSTKYYCTKLHHLAWRTEPKRFFLFSRVTYHTGRDQRVPLSVFFGIVRLFFRKKNFPKGSPFNVLQQNGCWKIPKGPPFNFFGIVRFFSEKNFPKWSPFQFFDVLRQNGC